MREMENGTPIDETEAAKVLNSDVVESAVRIVDGCAVLVSLSKEYVIVGAAITSPDKASTASPGPLKSNKPQKPSEDRSKKDPKKEYSKSRPEEQQTWWERLWGWFAVASEASSFFEKVRKARYESSNRKDSKPAPSWNIWSSIRKWWPW